MSSQGDAPSSSTATTPASTSTSPIHQLLSTLGMTREDLEKHTSQMRQFLDSEHAQKVVRVQANGELRGDSGAEMLAYLTGVASAQNMSKRPAMPPPTRSSHHETSSPSSSVGPALRHSRSTSRISKLLSLHAHESERSSERSGTRRSRTHTRSRHRSHTATSPSTSSRPKLSLDEVMQMRSSRRRRVSLSEESDESDDESLRDVFVKSTAGVSTPHYKYPHPARTARSSLDTKQHYRQHSPVPSRGSNYYRDELYTNANPHTPTRNLGPKSLSYYRHTYAVRNHLPPSSPPATSPVSSPSKYPYNFVSSPGPMSDPADQFSEELPYTLPPGPYSNEKPEFSYAALIGQAILASPDHALRLKDIYDYISTVYSYFKRDGHSHSQKWMNAIRQNLTNTPQFFKKEHPSGKASKGALWCIADKDLPCFAEGGYNRHALNPDSVQSQKAEKRKRKKEEKLKEEKAKKARLTQVVHSGYTYPYGVAHFPFATTPIPAPVHSDLIFPPLPPDHPNAYLVNTASTSNETLDDGIIFPPLPAYSQTRIAQERRSKELSGDTASSPPTSPSCRSPEPASDDCEPSSPILAPPLSSEASTSSVPDLTPNNSSSSPREGEDDGDEDGIAYFSEYLESETQSLCADSAYGEEDEVVTNEVKGKEKETADGAPLYTSEPPSHMSPELLTSQATRSPSTSLYASAAFLGYSVNRSSTPPNDLSKYLSGSHTLTPLGRRNLSSTPTRKRKTSNSVADNLLGSEERCGTLKATPRTPTRRRDDASSGAGASNVPDTPRKIFSPFVGFSPFRTPSRRSIFDAADPSRILDDELEALALAKQHAQDSPAGLFPRGKGLLYESPSMPSPGKWRPW